MKARARKIASSPRLLEEYVQRLSKEYPRSTIILFGSRARGENQPPATTI